MTDQDPNSFVPSEEPVATTPQSTPPTSPPEPTQPALRRRRWAAGVAATALVLASAGVGVAVGQHSSRSATASAAPPPQQSTVLGGGQRGRQVPVGGGEFSGPGGGAVPNGGLGMYGAGAPSVSTTPATGTQISGLVRVDSTLGYADGEAAGTGMVLTSNGEVVTNHHVVAGATKVTATVMSTGKTYTAQVVGTDAKDDVAVLQLVGASGLTTVATDTSAQSVGDAVTAVGDANGTTDSLSAAEGTVLALRQSISTQSDGTSQGQQLTGLMEISSDVIAGDSGGATYDAQGEVIGMTTAASSGGDVVGYAIPIAKVLRVAGDLESGATSSSYAYGLPAFLGIALGGSTPVVAGVYQGTPAASAGLTAGDTITAVDGAGVSTSDALHSAIAAHSPGDSVRLTWTDASGTAHSASLSLVAGPVA